MATRMVVQAIKRLTLVRKGRGTAKHPDMRDGAVEKVSASTPPSPVPTPPVASPPQYTGLDRYRSGQWG